MLSPRPSSVIVVLMLMIHSVFCEKLFSREFDDAETKFIDYIEQFNKSYRFDVNEYRRRFITFQTSLQMIERLNTHRTHSDSARFGFTQYSDMTHGEFVAAKLNTDVSKVNHHINSIHKEAVEHHKTPTLHNIIRYARGAIGDTDRLPKKIDWRERGVVSKVRNQGRCGACWAHSVVGTVESISAIERNSSTVDLSVQQMIDCAANNYGCRGGDTCNLLEWLVKESVVIRTMEEYPTNDADTQCKMGEIKNITQTVQVNWFTCESYVGREQKILYLLANYGPVVAAVNGLLWQNYLGGVIQFHCDGSNTSLNHAVQIVGYDMTEDTIPHYIVRNSWGHKFGNKGYLKIEIGRNICGLANQISALGVKLGSSN